VQAPAGSGKTGLLVQRLLVLLVTVEAPEQVVAITFTRKAAGEMRARVADALNAAKGPAPSAPHEKNTWQLARAVVAKDAQQQWGLLDNPGRLRIQTFDALCATIARQMPYLSMSGGESRVAEAAGELYREAAKRTVSHLDGGAERAAPVADLLAHLDNNLPRVVDLLMQMLARRDQWLTHLVTDDPSALLVDLEASLARLVTDTVSDAALALHNEIDPDELTQMAVYAAEHLPPDRGDFADGIKSWSANRVGPETLETWRSIAELLLTKDGAVRKSINVKIGFPAATAFTDSDAKARAKQMKARMVALLAAIDPDADLLSHLGWVRALPNPIYPDAQRRMLLALCTVLPLAVAELSVVFAETGSVDFAQVAQSALTALGAEEAPTDLGLALDYAIRHLLVDEFQDTSRGQFSLVARLVAGWLPMVGSQPKSDNTLFVVGDPMQSIYRFREAEVALFLRARRRGIGPVTLENLLLSTNFRSRPAVVEWVNQGFKKVFPVTEEATRGAVSYSPSAAGVTTSGGGVSIHPMAGRDDEAEAELVCELIKKAQADDPGGSIAVLVRSRPHLKAVLPAMASADIGFRAVDIAPLAKRPAVADLISLTRALIDPADRIAWLALLRAPWCGVSLADLTTLVGNDRSITVAQALADPARLDSLSDDGRRRIVRVWMVLSRALKRRGQMRLAPWVEQTWVQLWGPATVSPGDLPDTVRYLDLLDGLDGGGDLPSLNQLMERVADLYAADHSTDNIEVMTIHKAKGLEFDTVIVPGLGRGGATDDPPLLQWLERTVGASGVGDALAGVADEAPTNLLMAAKGEVGEKPDRLYRYLQKIQSERGLFERQRLLYVAATRARGNLHLIGFARQNAKQEWKPQGGSLLDILWPAVADDFSDLLEGDALADATPPSEALSIHRLPSSFAPPQPADPVTAPPRETDGEITHPTYDWAGEMARHVGTVPKYLGCRQSGRLCPALFRRPVRLGSAQGSAPKRLEPHYRRPHQHLKK
jgi:ATP-dependent exoDNAse (exonuclease V) beta subunit